MAAVRFWKYFLPQRRDPVLTVVEPPFRGKMNRFTKIVKKRWPPCCPGWDGLPPRWIPPPHIQPHQPWKKMEVFPLKVKVKVMIGGHPFTIFSHFNWSIATCSCLLFLFLKVNYKRPQNYLWSYLTYLTSWTAWEVFPPGFDSVIRTIVPGLISPPRSNIGAWAITLEKVKVSLQL